MSSYKLFLKTIFFLALILENTIPNLVVAQAVKNLNSISIENTQFLGEILFIANVNGVIENCDCGHPPLGGLPQISTIINHHLSKNNHSYFIDGGDFINTYPYPLLNAAIVNIYKTMNLDYLSLGDQEWIDTEKIDQKVLKDLNKKIIASNYKIKNTDLKKSGYLNLKDGSKAYVLSYLDENAFYVSEDKKNINFNDEQFLYIYNKLTVDESLLVLIYHGTNYKLNWIKMNFPKINLILSAHEQSKINALSEIPAIVGGGADGEYIKQVKIYREQNKYQFKVNSIPVSADVECDPKITLIVDQFNIADEAEKGTE